MNNYHMQRDLEIRLEQDLMIDKEKQCQMNWQALLERIYNLIRLHGIENIPQSHSVNKVCSSHIERFGFWFVWFFLFVKFSKCGLCGTRSSQIIPKEYYLGKNILTEIIHILGI